jgi:histidine triad (HIT) family protein
MRIQLIFSRLRVVFGMVGLVKYRTGEKKMPECVFCRILREEAPASFVYRDERVAAFMDIQPVTPGHLLVVPLNHATYLSDLDLEDGAQLFRVGQQLTAALFASGLRCEGTNFFLANGATAGQDVFHVHLHVIPRFRGDGFGLRFGSDYGLRPPRADLDAQALQIQSALRHQKK